MAHRWPEAKLQAIWCTRWLGVAEPNQAAGAILMEPASHIASKY
jgi:hypothetical protein